MQSEFYLSYQHCSNMKEYVKKFKSVFDDRMGYISQRFELNTSLPLNYYIHASFAQSLIHESLVSIFLLEKNMIIDEWLKFEVEESFKVYKYKNRYSLVNGIICVIMKDEDVGYSWFFSKGEYNKDFSLPLMLQLGNNKLKNNINISWKKDNMYYVDYVFEDDFFRKPDYYLDKAKCKGKLYNCYNINNDNVENN